MKKKYFQMRLFTFCHQILSILTIGANIGSCPSMLPFHFHDSQVVYTVDVNGILTEVSSPTLEDDLIVFNEKEYHCYMVQWLDYGDPLIALETGEEMQKWRMKIFREILGVQPQDQEERQRRPRESSFLFYY